MKFLIPSYKRAGRVLSYDTLISLGVDPSDIYIGAQGKDEAIMYASAYPSAVIVENSAHNLAGNRNALIKCVKEGERAVCLDDDFKGFFKAVPIGEGKYKSERLCENGFSDMIEFGFSQLRGGVFFGIQSTANIVMAARQLREGKVAKNRMLTRFFGFVGGNEIEFDESVHVGEDYEACLRAVALGRDVYKLLEYMPDVVENGRGGGGCSDLYGSDVRWHNWLKDEVVAKYPKMVRFTNSRRDCTTLMMAGVK